MSSLLVDLFKYRSREKREAMEDWLTECVAAILRALPPHELAEALKSVTGQNCAALLEAGSVIGIATQVVIEKRIDHQMDAEKGKAAQREVQRPDMVISIDGHPWLVFENKVAHAVDHDRASDASRVSQLERYGTWLQDQQFGSPGLVKALVFVTHFTPVPPGYMTINPSEPGYRGLKRYVATWGSLSRAFEAVTADFATSVHARVLVDAFAEFLKEHGMSDESPASQDVALLGLQIGSTDRLKKLVDDMFVRVQGIGNWNGNTVWAEADVKFGRFNSYRWVHLPDGWPEGCYLNTGLWFPDSPDQRYRTVMDEELGEHGSDPITSAPKVFLQLAHEEDDMFPEEGLPGEEWLRPVSDFFVFRDYDSFHGDPAARAVSIFSWLDERVEELREFIGATDSGAKS